MAGESVLDLDVDLTKFLAGIQKAEEALKQLEKPIKIDVEFTRKFLGGDGGASGGGSASSVGGTRDITNRDLEVLYKRDSLKYYKNFGEYNKQFKSFSAEMQQITRGMIGIGSNLLKLAAGGAFGAAAGIIGGVMPLARNVVDDRKAALALGGANIGKMRAAGTAFAGIGVDVPSALSSISSGQFDITSKAYQALKLMGFSDSEIQGSDPSDLLAKAMSREQKRMQSYPNRQTAITMETARGATNIFSPDALKALGSLPRGELEDREKQYQSLQKSLDLTQKEQEAIGDLTRHVQAAGEEIETVFERNLAQMAPYMEKFSDWIADFVVNKIPHEEGGLVKKFGEGTIKDLIVPFLKLNDKIEKWFSGGGASSGASDQTTRGFTDALKDFTDWVKTHLPDLSSAAGELGGGGGGAWTGSGAPPSIRRRGSHGGHAPNEGMTGTPASSAEVNAIIADAQKTGKFPDTIAGHTAFIRMMSPKYGIDPQFAVDVAASEGLFSKRKSQGSNVDVDPATGQPYSFWDYQLNYKRGVGTFAAKEGIDPNRPTDWMKADEFALRWMAAHGMGDWRTDAAFRKYGGRVKTVPVEDPKIPKLPAVLGGDADRLKAAGQIDTSSMTSGGSSGAPKGNFHFGKGTPWEYPSPTEKSGPQSMNNMSIFQGNNKQMAIRIDNRAGADYSVSSGMLGAQQGNYG